MTHEALPNLSGTVHEPFVPSRTRAEQGAGSREGSREQGSPVVTSTARPPVSDAREPVENPAECSTPEPERELIRDARIGYSVGYEISEGDPPPSAAWFRPSPSSAEERAHRLNRTKATHRCKACEVTWSGESKICWACNESVDRFIPRPVAFRPVVAPATARFGPVVGS